MKTRYVHINFDLVNGRWYCYSNHTGEDLGQVYYDVSWKGLVWQQEEDVRFSISCIDDLRSFMKQLKKK